MFEQNSKITLVVSRPARVNLFHLDLPYLLSVGSRGVGCRLVSRNRVCVEWLLRRTATRAAFVSHLASRLFLLE